MSAGTLTLTNNSDAVTGAGTLFTSELVAGDFIVATVGGVTYTLPVKTINSDTDLKLARNYNGPGISGIAWTAMPRDTLNRISAQMAADTAYIIGQRVLEVENWYQLLEVNGDVVIKMADGSSYTGPSWLKLIDVMKTLKIDELIPIAEQIRADAQQVADDKPVIIQAKDDAQAAAAAAAASENNAAESETNSAASEEVATQKAKEAKDSAEQAAAANPLLALQKSLNLSDLADRAASWLNVRPIGATPLASDPVSDYDAATMRWVQNLLNSGTAGPTMNGVMNLGVGAPVMWETRAYIPPYCLPRDGQLVNRADWPELWAWAQKTTPITDAAWLADVTKRGSYSTGNGTTTFRLPDWNGVQSGSIPGVFFRGGNGTADMTMSLSAAPNITGSTGLVLTSHTTTSMGSLTDNWFNYWSTAAPNGSSSNTYRENSVGIDASKSSLVYGRNNTSEVVPNKVSGVWLVRASGGFEAANTSWSVTNADTAMPGNGTVVRGGAVRSAYQAAGSEKAAAELQAVLTTSATGVKAVTAEVVVKDSTLGSTVSKTIKLGTVDGLTGGTIYGNIISAAGSVNGGYSGIEARNTAADPLGVYFNATMGGYFRGGLEFVNDRDGKYGFSTAISFSRNSGITGDHREAGLRINSNGTTWMVSQPTYGSDERLKDNIEDISSTRDELRSLRTVYYDMDGRRQVGLIAQDVQKCWPELIDNFEKVMYSESGEKTEGTYLSLNYTGMIAPTIKAVNENSDAIDRLMDIVKEAITTIAGVTTDEKAKAALEALAERIPAPDTQ